MRNWWIWAETKEKRPGPIEALVLLPPRWIHADLGWVGSLALWLVGCPECLCAHELVPRLSSSQRPAVLGRD